MKLAELLIERSDVQKRIDQLKSRILLCVKVQEGETTPEDPLELISEMDCYLEKLTTLVKEINRTNNLVEFESGMTLADALAERDILSHRRSILHSIVAEASIRIDRYSKSEVKFIATVNVADIQKDIDRISKAFRQLDTKIQEKNWTVDL